MTNSKPTQECSVPEALPQPPSDCLKSKVRYSVIIASYRRPNLLLQTLESLMPQVGADGEVIVIEQCPRVDLRGRLSHQPRLRHFVLDTPGAVEARNYGILVSTGEIIIFVDDDVIAPEGFLVAHLAGYSDPSVGGIAGKVKEVGRPAGGTLDPRSLHPTHGWRYTTFDHDTPGDVPHAPTCNLSLRSALIFRVGGFDPNFRLAWREDSDLCFRVRAEGSRIHYDPSAWLTHLSASEGGTRGEAPPPKYWVREWMMYKKHFAHYRDNLYFIMKHFRGRERRRWVVDAYCTYVGLSRWPWRLCAKNFSFALALVLSVRASYRRRLHPCRLVQESQAKI